MAEKHVNLLGEEPERSPVALILIDVINSLEFPEREELLEHALPMARRIAKLKERARQAGIPTVYANDNFGRWRSDFRAYVEHCLKGDAAVRQIVELLRPDSDDYFVLKPRHSGFYSTTLDVLLGHLGARTLILTGIAGNICVLFTAHDAYLRDYRLVVPADCVASNQTEDNEAALRQMQTVLKSDTRNSSELNLAELVGATRLGKNRLFEGG